MKKIVILGVTGSIGENSLRALDELKLSLYGIAFKDEIDKASAIIDKYNPEVIVVATVSAYDTLKKKYPHKEILVGLKGMKLFLQKEDLVVINGINGINGIYPSYYTVLNGNTLLVANKETIICIGEELLKLSYKTKASIIPIDSEHSAINSLLKKYPNPKQIIITASGGSLRDKTKEELKCVTKEEVLNHPVWKMGPSITVNSANLSNKAMEVFEARILFQKYTSDISVKIEKNGIIHGMIVLPNGDIYKHVSTPIMSEFIKDGLNQALDLGYDFFHIEPMKKEEFLSLADPSLDRYPLFKLAFVNHNPLFPLVYTAVIEGLTEAFLEDKIEFLDIEKNAVKLIGKFPDNLTLSIKQKIDYYEEIKNQVKKEFSK